jgi:transposase-like protein
MRIKHCPKCGSTQVYSFILYRPSIWRCVDCGYEGAFIIEGSELLEQEGYLRRTVIDRIEGGLRISNCDCSTDNMKKPVEDGVKLDAAII